MNRLLLLIGAAGVLATANGSTITLNGTIRDFKRGDQAGGHPDFESTIAFDPGIVQSTLGSDGKPVYAGLSGNPTTHGQTAFDQWYRDVSGVNLSTAHAITLNEISPGIFSFSSGAFFPIDNQLFGNQGLSHNYHFTYELHTQFTYVPGQHFNFSGDDDVWVFINGQLVIDLGGVHSSMSDSVTPAELAGLGLIPGQAYNLDFFFAERHTSASNFRIDTSLVLESRSVPDGGATAGLLAIGLLGLASIRRRV